MSKQNKRGSLTDVVTLNDYPFFFEPSLKGTDKTSYATREIIGNRLPSRLWIGQGSGDVELDVFLLDQSGVPEQSTVLSELAAFKTLLEPQSDIGAPHPVYINTGSMYVGRWFVIDSMESIVRTFKFDATMTPYEVELKIKLSEIPVNTSYTGTGA